MLLDKDYIRLTHMLEAGLEAFECVNGRARAEFYSERSMQHTVIRCLEILGEAASRITPEFRKSNPEVPWRQIIGMRNRVVHVYFDLDLDTLWHTALYEIPVLLPLMV